MTPMQTDVESVARSPSDDAYEDYDGSFDGGCYECGGEGFVSNCVSDYACIDPEYGCDLCTYECDLCGPKARARAAHLKGNQNGN
jgi:hypothetical protein